ncbi:MAG: DeoR/GlpR family DNA-binding transcription regulator [Actinomycetaceae bacterium]|nr:DeoR/GlpR family DNA-binding transcription regulator [Actinomycetaceae bacterium]
MKRQDRQSTLVELVVEHGQLTVEQMVELVNASPATIRRDLDVLSEQQLITRVRGGARANATSGDLPMRYRTSRQWQEKQQIAKKVASMVCPGDVISFNGGTTTTAAAYEIGLTSSANPAFQEAPITVVTNAVNIANDLAIRPCVKVVVIGGVVRARSYELIGSLAQTMLPRISAGTLFLGVSALNLEAQAFFTNHEGEAQINAELVGIADKIVVLADSSKLGTSAFAKICDFSSVDMIITDRNIQQEHRSILEAAGVEVVVA